MSPRRWRRDNIATCRNERSQIRIRTTAALERCLRIAHLVSSVYRDSHVRFIPRGKNSQSSHTRAIPSRVARLARLKSNHFFSLVLLIRCRLLALLFSFVEPGPFSWIDESCNDMVKDPRICTNYMLYITSKMRGCHIPFIGHSVAPAQVSASIFVRKSVPGGSGSN